MPDHTDEFFTLAADRFEAIEKVLGSEVGQELARARRAAARERRLLKEEILASEGVAARAADDLMKVHDSLADAQASFKALVEASKGEILAKERSARNSSNFKQHKVPHKNLNSHKQLKEENDHKEVQQILGKEARGIGGHRRRKARATTP